MAILLHKCLRKLNFSTFPSKTKETGRERKERKRIQKERGSPCTVTNRSGETTDESWKDKVLESPTHTQRRPWWTGALRRPLSVTNAHAQQDHCHNVATMRDAMAGLQEKVPPLCPQLVLDVVPGP